MGAPLSAATTYRLHQRVGRGGMGSVHLGTMLGPAGERRVAIKQLHANVALGQGADSRLLDEARLVFQLTHANICQVFDVASNADGLFVVMELVDGMDLRALAKRGGPLQLPHALYIGREIARALDYAHRRVDGSGRPLMLVHGDVTPANVLVSREGEVKLADFGIARALGGLPDSSQVIAGTPGFIAPELRSHGTSQRADLFALGVTIYVALSGTMPGAKGFDPSALRRVRPDASPELERLVAQATAADPRERIASGAQLEQALAVELARRFAEFTPSSLARVIADLQQSPATPNPDVADPDAPTCVLHSALNVLPQSIVRIAADAAPVSDAALEPDEESKTTHGTMTAPPRTARGRTLWLGMPLLAIAAGALAYHMITRPPNESAPSHGHPIAQPASVVPAPAQPATPAVEQPTAPATETPPAIASAAPPAPTKRATSRHPPQSHAATTHVPPPPAAAPGFLTVTARSWGAIYVDGHQVASQTPLYKLSVAAGHHRIKLFHPSSGEYSTEQDVDVLPGEVSQVSFK